MRPGHYSGDLSRMNIFSDCMSIGYAAIEDVAGEDLVYRDQIGDISIRAVAEDQAANELESGNQFRSGHIEQAWLVRACTLVRGDMPIKPQLGHRIIRDDGRTFQVQNPRANAPWEWSTAQRTHYRIFTVEIPATP